MSKTNNTQNTATMEERLNTIRAGVLGSNDGILTVVGVLFSVAAATTNQFTIIIAGIADLLACALSMASGEYASVSAQSDAEKVAVKKEAWRVKNTPIEVEQDIVDFYYQRGVTLSTSKKIAAALMQKQPLETILSCKYNIRLEHYVNPWAAAFSSAISASLGGLFPLLALVYSPIHIQLLMTILATVLAVALTGALSARFGHAYMKKSIIRNVIIGLLTIAIHYGIGRLF
ncbi:putative membrane protein [Weissella oryzae SG25]|uniref:Putative membrane protein n=1 Tax=Weissella oryzae (strain DSM 25784 / JCM 18191 / LMG 30913 / SG25) TaxID=1329250 RepID=A0A069D1H0_WEIOS|nr:VIT family protein [Weissella oryzae]GAK31201.1 putative membrane protein [Weissella oryzae SG25]